MAKKVTGKQSLSAVRLTQEAKEKLCVIAERKCTTLGIAASRIILHYATNNLDYEVSAGDVLKAILQNQVSHQVTLVKVAGSVSRTEDFIKSLLRRDDRPVLSEYAEPGTPDLMMIQPSKQRIADSRKRCRFWKNSSQLRPTPLISGATRLCKSVCRKRIMCVTRANTKNYVYHRLCR